MPESYKEDGRPSDQWYWDDWFSSHDVHSCSLAAQGLWINLIGIMFTSEVRGTLAVNGIQMDNKAIARRFGRSIASIDKLVAELEGARVFSRLPDGTIYSRRMYRRSKMKEKISRIRAGVGKKGAESRWGKRPEEEEKKYQEEKKEREEIGLGISSFIRSQRLINAKKQGKHNSKQWQKLKEAFDFVCPCCGKKEPKITLTKDHIIPISQGGSDHISNIQPLCQSCNSAKGRERRNFKKMAKNGKYQMAKITGPSSSSTPPPTSIKTSCSEKHSELAFLLESKIKERLPKQKFVGKDYLEKWANVFRLMEEKKEATFEEVKELIIWIFKDDFWYKNILSGEKLRKQFGRLWAEMKDDKKKRGVQTQEEFNAMQKKALEGK